MKTFNRRTGGWLLLTLVFCVIASFLFFAGDGRAAPIPKADASYHAFSVLENPMDRVAPDPVIDVEAVIVKQTAAPITRYVALVFSPPPGSPQRYGQLARSIGTNDAEHRYQCQCQS